MTGCLTDCWNGWLAGWLAGLAGVELREEIRGGEVTRNEVGHVWTPVEGCEALKERTPRFFFNELLKISTEGEGVGGEGKSWLAGWFREREGKRLVGEKEVKR